MSFNKVILSEVDNLQKQDSLENTTTLKAAFTQAPLKPSLLPECDKSIIYGKSAFQAETECGERYRPVESGGFELTDTEVRNEFNRAIVHGRNKLLMGDKPIFKAVTTTGSGVYDGTTPDRCFPIFPRDKAELATGEPCLGILRIAAIDSKGNKEYLHELQDIKAVFMPGYSKYNLTSGNKEWEVELLIAPALDFHGYIVSLKSDKKIKFSFEFGDLFWRHDEENSNEVSIHENYIELTEKNLPECRIFLGTDKDCSITSEKSDFGQKAVFTTSGDENEITIYSTWGVDKYDKEIAESMQARINTDNTKEWQSALKELQEDWFDCYIGRALNPEGNFSKLKKAPESALKASVDYWTERLNEFQIKTPDPYLNAAVNFQRAVSDYHRMGPGLVLSADMWIMYSHISVGWYGKLWAGDIETVKKHLRFLASVQREDGYIPWISPSLASYKAEDNTPYWVEQIWWVYAWSGDLDFLKDMWKLVQKAVDFEQKNNDPNNDGLFKSEYEYWNCDSNGKGPKAAAPTTTAWAMYYRASKMAEALNDDEIASKYLAESEKIKKAAMDELWDDELGILGSIGNDEIRRTHPQIWEEYLGIITGMLPPDQGRRAMRYLESHYGFDGDKGVRLLLNCDWWPLRWSMHWVPVGDSLLATMAGMKCGDTDLWKPYMETVVRSGFRRYSPALGFGISNTGSAGGDIEDVDAVDPHSHMTVRGLFGITPEIHNGKIHIAPAFPSDWTEAEITTPIISYKFSKKNGKMVLDITTREPMIKVITPYYGAEAVTTASETHTVIELDFPEKSIETCKSQKSSAVIADLNRKDYMDQLSSKEVEVLENIDLSEYYNTTLSELTHNTKFITDFSQETTIKDWWHTVPAHITEGDEVIKLENGLSFLLKGRNESVQGKCNNLLALSSWGKPYPFPAGIEFSVQKRTEAVWFMMQNHVSPIKNYIPNGEIILKYEDKTQEVTSLIPPYNLDCYFQAFSQEGTSIEFGELEWGKEWTPCTPGYSQCQAHILKVKSNPDKVLKSIEIRATVTEGVLGINAITMLPATQH